MVAVAAMLLTAGAAQQANASLIGLTPSLPDIVTGFVFLDYDSSKKLLDVEGFVGDITTQWQGPPAYYPFDYYYSINASIDNAGRVRGGTLIISGKIAGLGLQSGTLLTGNLSQFGFSPCPGDVFEFTFDVTGGDLASYFGPHAGVILDPVDSGFNGSFASNFSNTGYGVSDTFPVPEPVSLVILALGACPLLLRRKGT